jgi:hypothetical protein
MCIASVNEIGDARKGIDNIDFDPRNPTTAPDLATLLDCISTENVHAEVDIGPAVGNEAR